MDKIRNKIYHALRWSEQYAKTDMVYATKSGFWITFGQVSSSVLSLLLVVAFANLLPKETYGMYRYILSIAGVLNIFTLTGMNNAVSRSVAAGSEGAFKESVKYQLKWNLMMLLAFWILGIYYFVHGNMELFWAFAILGIFVPPTLAFNTYGAYLDGKREFKLASISSVISTFIYVVGVFAAILFGKNVVWIVLAYALTTFIGTYYFYSFSLRKFKPNELESHETLKYGRELTFIGFIGPIASQIDKIVLTHFWGATQLAVYSLAMAVPDRATGLIKDLVGVGFPKFATKTSSEINTIFYRRILQGMFIGGLCMVAYVLLAPYLFKYILPQYLDSIFYSQVLSISLVFAMPNRYVSLLLVSQKYSKAIFNNSIIQSLVRIMLYVVLGALGGIMGLVIAFVLMSALATLINIVVWRSNSKV